MAKHSLLHRADCEASGTAEQFAAALKDGHEPVFLCAHHTDKHTAWLDANEWTIVILNERAPVPA
jgi:hypothetical protein